MHCVSWPPPCPCSVSPSSQSRWPPSPASLGPSPCHSSRCPRCSSCILPWPHPRRVGCAPSRLLQLQSQPVPSYTLFFHCSCLPFVMSPSLLNFTTLASRPHMSLHSMALTRLQGGGSIPHPLLPPTPALPRSLALAVALALSRSARLVVAPITLPCHSARHQAIGGAAQSQGWETCGAC